MAEQKRKHKSGKHKPREQKREGWIEVSDEFWQIARLYIPPLNEHPRKGGRQAADERRLLNGMLYVLRTGCQWKMIPKDYYAGSTTHRYFQRWAKAGVFEELWAHCLEQYDELVGIDWEWQILDSQTVQSPVKKGRT
jgi:putative transposase